MIVDADTYLEHFGKKGMKWGVRKEEPPSSGGKRKKNSDKTPDLTSNEQSIIKKMGPHGYDAARMHRMYGPDLPPVHDEHKGLSDGQKKALKVGAGFVVAGVVLYGLGKVGEKANLESVGLGNASDSMKEFWKTQQRTAGHRANRGFSKDFVKNLSDESTTFSPGDIVKRISSEKEFAIRPDGFFASHKTSDIENYKAVLPVYWKAWGLNATEGHVISLQAVEEVRVPSPKRTYDMVRETFDTTVNVTTISGGSRKVTVRDLVKEGRPGLNHLNDEDLLRRTFPTLAGRWIQSDDPVTKVLFDKLKSSGFNAVPDLNDAGNLADSPIRFLNGSSFKIAGTEPLTSAAIKAAQEKILVVKHVLEALMGLDQTTINYLEHFGKKGMKWGVRNEQHSFNRKRRKLERVNSDSALTGYNLKGASAQKISNKRLKKDAGWDLKGFQNLSQKERDAYNRKISLNAYGATLIRGTIQTAIVLGSGKLLLSQMNLNPKLLKQGETSVKVLAASFGLTQVKELKGIHDANKLDKLRAEVYTPNGDLRRN